MTTTDPFNITWHKGDIIRKLSTGKPYLVIQVFTRFATLVIDLEEKISPSYPQLILMRDYREFAKDQDMIAEVKKNDILEWHYQHISL